MTSTNTGSSFTRADKNTPKVCRPLDYNSTVTIYLLYVA